MIDRSRPGSRNGTSLPHRSQSRGGGGARRRGRRFVAGDPVAEVEPVDEVVVVQELEDPVDARPRHSALAGLTAAQGVLHLQRAERAVLAGE